MKMQNATARELLNELEAEAKASRTCLLRIPAELFDYKPHEKSMPMGYLALIVAEIPRWITHIIEKSEIDLATFDHPKLKSGAELADYFDKNMEDARKSLGMLTDAMFDEPFSLKNNGAALFTSPKRDNLGSSINHMVHHRGQLTVYMRLNNILVPPIYGPSADEKVF